LDKAQQQRWLAEGRDHRRAVCGAFLLSMDLKSTVILALA
jgi:hypothetical protein